MESSDASTSEVVLNLFLQLPLSSAGVAGGTIPKKLASAGMLNIDMYETSSGACLAFAKAFFRGLTAKACTGVASIPGTTYTNTVRNL